MVEYSVSTDFVKRFRNYLSSDEFKNIPAYSKSEYWEYHSDAIDISISGNKIIMSGKSGFYIPPRQGVKSSVKKIIKLVNEPSKLISCIKRKFGAQKSAIRLLSYFDAFNKIMNEDPIADIDLAPYRINFKKLKEKPGIIVSIDGMRQKYFAKDKYRLSPPMVKTYYYYNILHGYIDLIYTKAILEIGGGNGNFSSLLYSSMDNCTIISVDLPETLCLSIVFIADLFPEARMLLPHEEKLYDFNHYDFVFLTPKQISMIEDNSIDLAINFDSFQEMTHKQIKEYFQLIQRCCKNNSYFFTANRVEKIPCASDSYEKETSEPPNRFSDYPWNPANDILIYEISKLIRLVQLDNIYVRLEKVKK